MDIASSRVGGYESRLFIDGDESLVFLDVLAKRSSIVDAHDGSCMRSMFLMRQTVRDAHWYDCGSANCFWATSRPILVGLRKRRFLAYETGMKFYPYEVFQSNRTVLVCNSVSDLPHHFICVPVGKAESCFVRLYSLCCGTSALTGFAAAAGTT